MDGKGCDIGIHVYVVMTGRRGAQGGWLCYVHEWTMLVVYTRETQRNIRAMAGPALLRAVRSIYVPC